MNDKMPHVSLFHDYGNNPVYIDIMQHNTVKNHVDCVP